MSQSASDPRRTFSLVELLREVTTTARPDSAGCAPVYDRAICVGGWSGAVSMMRFMGGATILALGVPRGKGAFRDLADLKCQVAPQTCGRCTENGRMTLSDLAGPDWSNEG
jgi:hypothetical protein